jgi:N-acyl-D-amino-acid deacylase
MVGHGAIRAAALGLDARDPTPDELKKMRELTAEAMEAGAYGVTTGLIYPPGIFAKTKELIEVSKVAARYGGIYDSHIRGEGDTLMAAVKEAITIGEKAGLPVQISHHKASNKSVWGKSVETLQMIEDARGRGIDVTVDQYPYPAGATSLVTLLPPWVHDGGTEKLLERLRDPKQRERIRKDLEDGVPGWENFSGELGWDKLYVSSVKSEKNKPVEGLNFTEIKALRKEKDEFTVLWKLLLEEEGSAGMIVFSMDEGDIRRIMQSPYQMVGTDSSASALSGPFSRGKPHPRFFGTYPRILCTYVREENVLRLEEAIRKMTSFPAQRFGILDRGLIRPGMKADITVFSPEDICDKSTFKNPQAYPEGLPYVIVNGKVAVDCGKSTGALAGRTLRKRA